MSFNAPDGGSVLGVIRIERVLGGRPIETTTLRKPEGRYLYRIANAFSLEFSSAGGGRARRKRKSRDLLAVLSLEGVDSHKRL